MQAWLVELLSETFSVSAAALRSVVTDKPRRICRAVCLYKASFNHAVMNQQCLMNLPCLLSFFFKI